MPRHPLRALVLSTLAAVPTLTACGGGGGGGGSKPPPVDPLRSSFTATPRFGTSADGVAAAEMTVVLADSGGLPLPGRRVRIDATGFENALAQPALTDGAGTAKGTLRTIVGERKLLTAVIDPGPDEVRMGPVEVEFLRILPNWRFVRTSGSDAADGRTPLTAWATIARALSEVGPGDVLFVGAGTYAEPLVITTQASAAAPLEIRGDTSGAFTGDPGEVLVDAGGATAGIELRGARSVTLRGLSVRGSDNGAGHGGGIYATGARDCAVLACRIYENRRGLELENTIATWVEANRISANSGDGVRLVATTGTRFLSNLVYANGSDGIELTLASSDVSVQFNTFYRNAGDQIRESTTGSTGVLANNVFAEGTGRGLGLSAGSGLGTDANLSWSQSGNTPSTTYTADPMFSDPFGPDGVLGGPGAEDDDFRVLAGSPTLDVGMDLARRVGLRLAPALDTLGTRADGLFDAESPDAAEANLGAHEALPLDPFASLAPLGVRVAYAPAAGPRVFTRAFARADETWLAPRATQALGRDVRWLVHRVATGAKPEEILAAQIDTGAGARLLVRAWDARRWSDDAPAVFAADVAPANAGERGFDVEYEGLSGNAMLARVDGASNVLWQRLVDGAWSAPQPVFAPAIATGTVLWTELVPRAGTDELALVAVDDQENVFAAVWDGAAWTRAILLDTRVNELRRFQAFDAAFESLSGDLLVVWGFSVFAEETRFATLTRSTGTWTTGQFVSTDALGMRVALAADPASDRIVGVFGEGNSDDDVGVSVWNGANWHHTAEMTLTGIPASEAMEVGWLGTSGLAFVLYRDQAQTGAFQWALFNSGGWRKQPEVFLPGVGELVRAEARRMPGTERVLVMLLDDAGALWAVEHDGTGWILANGGEALATGLDPAQAGRAFDFDLRAR